MSKLKLFISYSHSDKGFVEDFFRHTSQLRDSGILEIWYDKSILAGDDFWDRIDEHLNDRDIICLFISSHYLDSNACKKEMEQALELRRKKGITVIPIILSYCSWKDNAHLNKLLAIPTDGAPIKSFQDQDKAWLIVYDYLKEAAESICRIKELRFSEDYTKFLSDASLLTKAHGNKEELKLEDIFVSPDLETFDSVHDKRIKVKFEDLLDEFSSGQKIAIVGEDQSGKTTLAKAIVHSLRIKQYIPVYIRDEAELLQGDLKRRVFDSFQSQYSVSDVTQYDVSRIVPIIDDFHKAKHKDFVLERLNEFKQLIIIVDAIFDLDVLQEKTVVDFDRYRIKQLKPSLRNALIKKWISVSERPGYDPEFPNNDFELIDDRAQMLDQALGRALGAGIMPAYPFFLLTLLSNYDTLNKPLNEEITSQGYCYQALIILFLAREKVSNDKIDTYINFLTEFAHAIYKNQAPLSRIEFDHFLSGYEEEFNLTEGKTTLLRKLKASGILKESTLGNYSFDYPYLYYFFAGKYFAEHLDKSDEGNLAALGEIEHIMDNLHKNENAYITIFMVHHTKDKNLIDRIVKRADSLFTSFTPATLDRQELDFFRTGDNDITMPSMPKPHNNAVEERKKALQRADSEEERQLEVEDEEDGIESELSKELRRSIKTVEVLGCILRNRAGSIKNKMLCSLFEKGVNVHLRVMSSFFDIVRKILASGEDYDSFIRERILEDNPNLSKEKAGEMARRFFWNMNFGFIIGMIRRISISLGSKTLIEVSDSVCDSIGTPAAFLIKQDIAMRSNKNLRIGELSRVNYKDFSPITINALLYLIAQHCRYNRVSQEDRAALKKLGLDTGRIPLLPKKQ